MLSTKVSDPGVTVVAEESSDPTGIVTVINCELVFPVSGREPCLCRLSADRAAPALALVHGVVVSPSDPIAVLETGVATGLVIVSGRAVPVGPLFLVVVGAAQASALRRLLAPIDGASDALPLPPLPWTATILWAVVKFLTRIHASSPSGVIVRNGCL